SPGPPEAEVKVVVVGDGGCGKTSLLLAFASGDFPKVRPSLSPGTSAPGGTRWRGGGDHRPTARRCGQRAVEGGRDGHGGGNGTVCGRTRGWGGLGGDSLGLTGWYPEVNHFCKGVPVLLVGCKTDLRKLQEGRPEPISHQKAKAMARQVHAVSYLECSARYQENVRDIFVAACDAALRAAHPNPRRRRPRRGCVLC
ncbi:RHOF protein, partial [Rissa tridactyla]|nr:RHOF protein [Rissa tridactyla]